MEKELKTIAIGSTAVGGDPDLGHLMVPGPRSSTKVTCCTGASSLAFSCFRKEVGSQYSTHKLYLERKTKDFGMIGKMSRKIHLHSSIVKRSGQSFPIKNEQNEKIYYVLMEGGRERDRDR